MQAGAMKAAPLSLQLQLFKGKEADDMGGRGSDIIVCPTELATEVRQYLETVSLAGAYGGHIENEGQHLVRSHPPISIQQR